MYFGIAFKSLRYLSALFLSMLPSLSIRLFGKPEKFSTKYNFDEIRKKFLNEGLLKFNSKEILKIPLKNGKEIDLKNIIEMFSN